MYTDLHASKEPHPIKYFTNNKLFHSSFSLSKLGGVL